MSFLAISGLAEKEVERLIHNIVRVVPALRGKVYSVGGYVRDELLGVDSKDLDIVVEKPGGAKFLCELLHRLFAEETSNPYQLGAHYPIWHISFKDNVVYNGEVFKTKGAEIDVADTQKEHFPDESSRQRETKFGTIRDDIERRDFTVNQLLKDLTNMEFVDLTGVAKKHLKEGLLTGIDLDKKFKDDPLRMLRLIRFQAKYGWKVPLYALKAIKRNAHRIKIVSAERIRDELAKIAKFDKGLYRAVRIMKATGLLKYVLPEIHELTRMRQHPPGRPNKHGRHMEGPTVFHHIIEVLKHAKPTLEHQLAALLHDVGKNKETQEILKDKVTFYGHEKVGAKLAELILKRLRFPNTVINKVVKAVRHHMRPHALSENPTPKALRRFIRDVGDALELVLDTADADRQGNLIKKGNKLVREKPDKTLRERILQLKKDSVPASNSKKKWSPLNGNEVMRLLKLRPGPDVGKALKILDDLVDEFGVAKMRNKSFAKKMLKKRWASSH